MQPPPRPLDEARRLEALRGYQLLDTLPEQAFDDLTALAAHICDTPISLISLVDEHRQWFKSKLGTTLEETARDVSFCGHTILDSDVFVVPDASLDTRFADNPLVTGDQHIRFYAGAPLLAPDGHALGALCVMDRVPHELTTAQADALRILGRQVMAQIAVRRQARSLRLSEERLRLVTDNARVGLVVVDRERRYTFANRAYAEILGLPSFDIVGRRVQDVMPDVYAAQVAPRLARAFDGDRITYELRRSGPAGDTHFSVCYEPIDADGLTRHVVVVITDVTELKTAMLDARRLAAIVESSNDAIVGHDLDGTITSWNAGAELLLGYPAAAIVGGALSRLLPPDLADEGPALLDALRRGEVVKLADSRRLTRGGNVLLVSVTASPIKDDAGRIVAGSQVIRDVTKRRRAEAQLREREDQLRLYAEYSPVAVAMFDTEMRYLVASRRWIEDYRLGDTPIVGRSHYEVFPDLPPHWRAIHQRCLAGAIERADEEPFRRQDGTVDWIRWEIRPWRRADGAIGGIILFSEDITERKRQQSALQASEARYRILFDSAPDGILIADSDSYYLDANPSMCRMLGYARDDLVGRHASEIVATAEVGHIAPALEVIHGGHDYHREWIFRRKDGSTFPGEVIATLMPDGRILAMIRDLTERQQADEALRSAEDRIRFALENAAVGIWDADYQTGVVRWSEILERQFGLAPGSFGGTFPAFLALVHPDDRDAVNAAIETAAQRGDDFSLQYRAVRPDGTLRWLSGVGRVHLDGAGRPLRAVGISLDVTDRLALEAQYQHAQKMEAIGRLAGGVAHDFNNLLTSILGYCELLLENDAIDAAARGDVAEIQKAGVSAASLTRQLLAFSRKEIIEPEVIDLHLVVEGVKGMLVRVIGEDVVVATAMRAHQPLVLADRGQLEQVLMNLAVNARDAMPAGGTLTIETSIVELDENYAARHFAVTPGTYVALSVSDTGVGMPPDVQAHLFEPFFTTKEASKGTGLGLATVHGIVSRCGGSVTVYSEPGRGTTFTVYLPWADETVRSMPDAAPAAQRRTESATVLVVEDSEGLRELARRLLTREGYQVVVAADAAEAERRFDEQPVDILLTDVVMPGASGPELTTRLRERVPELKVIYMSGYTEDGVVQHGVVRSGIAFLHKPFTSRTLAEKLREVLER